MGTLSWIVVGALAGWVSGLLAGTNRQQDWLENIIVGIIGALLGGGPFSLVAARWTTVDGNIGSFIGAVLGALVLLFVLQTERSKTWAY